jgi:hypothetical protein
MKNLAGPLGRTRVVVDLRIRIILEIQIAACLLPMGTVTRSEEMVAEKNATFC